jgi:hypothetical protein
MAKTENKTTDWGFAYDIAVTYPNDYAEMVMKTLQVDKEIRPHLVRRKFDVRESEMGECKELHVLFEAHNAQDLRTSVRSFFDFLILSTRTVRAFGDL